MGATLVASLFVGSAAADPAPNVATTNTKDFELMLRNLDAKERRLVSEVESIAPKLETVHHRMLARGRAYYRLVRAGLLPVGGGFEALVDHAAAVERLRAALGRDVRTERDLKGRRETAKIELRQVRTERAPLVIQRDVMRRAQSVMQQADERRAAFLRAFGGSSKSYAPNMAVYGATGPVQSGPLASFSEMAGKLSFPLGGRAVVHEPTGPTPEPLGISLVASRDTAVRAVYPGRIVFAGKGTGRGETVVIDHGNSYFSVYGQLNHLEVKENEEVSERTRIGWVLRYGDKSPTLYFEIRRGKKLLDAARWLGL